MIQRLILEVEDEIETECTVIYDWVKAVRYSNYGKCSIETGIAASGA